MSKKIVDILNNIQKDILYNNYCKIHVFYKFLNLKELYDIEIENIDTISFGDYEIYSFFKFLIDNKYFSVDKLIYKSVNNDEKPYIIYYDKKGNIKEEYYNDCTSILYNNKYNDNGQLLESITDDSNCIFCEYDANYNLISKTIKDKYYNVITEYKWLYDNNDRIINEILVHCKVEYITNYCYDERGNLKTKLTTTANNNLKPFYYEIYGRNLILRTRDNKTTSCYKYDYYYDDNDNILSYSDEYNGIILNFQYDENDILCDGISTGFDLTGFEITYKQQLNK